MIVYQFLYNEHIQENSYITISIHKTKEGAEKALNQHRNIIYKDWEEWIDHLMKGEEWIGYYNSLEDCLEANPFGKYKDWHIEEIEVLN